MKKLIIVALLGLTSTPLVSAATRQDPQVEKKWLKYYTERLPEAKQVLQGCVAKGFGKLMGEEKIKCEAARDAWHFQPYKAKASTFSSSGGRH